MIKAVITDVDGVIVGDKQGVNFPLPNDTIIQALKRIRKKGIPIILCSGKFSYAIEKIIKQADLDNPHITDNGALIYNPLRSQTIKEYVIDKHIVKKIVRLCLEKNIYLEVYTSTDYFVQKDQVSVFTDKRIAILQKRHQEVDSLDDLIPQIKVIKILTFIENQKYKDKIENLLKPLSNSIHTIWSTVPFMLPVISQVITAKEVSKKHAAEEVMKYLNISFNDVLGIGDLPADWKFISLCKYAATVGKVDKEFEENIKSKGSGNYLLAPPVDENGFIDIINYFIK